MQKKKQTYAVYAEQEVGIPSTEFGAIVCTCLSAEKALDEIGLEVQSSTKCGDSSLTGRINDEKTTRFLIPPLTLVKLNERRTSTEVYISYSASATVEHFCEEVPSEVEKILLDSGFKRQ